MLGMQINVYMKLFASSAYQSIITRSHSLHITLQGFEVECSAVANVLLWPAFAS